MKKSFLLSLFLLLSLTPPVLAEEIIPLNQKEIADLVGPSVVKIIQKVKGEAEIPAFKIDFNNLAVSIKEDEAPTKVPIDDYFFGSGFIVSPDGFIMTNSHVVSYQTVKNLIASDFIMPAISEGFDSLSEEELTKLGEKQDAITKFGEEIVNYVLDKSKFNLEKSVVVLNPGSRKEDSQSLFEEGIPTKIVSVNDDFYKDNKDVAILKIEENNLPAISLGKSENITTGSRVFIMGYPTTAELNSKGLVNSSFTGGIVSALKDSIDRSFKIIETDAKISKGSSGGPLVDEKGQVIGLVTFITGGATKEDGDSFAFAVPIDIVGKVIAEKMLISGDSPAFSTGNYNDHFLSGLSFFNKNRCKEAVKEFDLAKEGNNEKFSATRFLVPYQKKCQELIQSGQSIDSPLQILLEEMKDSKNMIWFGVSFGVFSFLVGSFYTYRLRKRMKKDEEELDNVEKYLHLNLEDGTPMKEEDKLEKLKPKVEG